MKNKGQVEIVDVFLMHERMYKLCGIWPLKKDYVKCWIYLVYSTISIILAYVEMVAVFSNLNLLIENFLETVVVTTSLIMAVVIRFHPSLGDLITTIKNDIAMNDYKTDEEHFLYYGYNRVAYVLSKSAMTASVLTVISMYLKPLPNALQAIYKSLGSNGTALSDGDLLLPFKGMNIFHITDIRLYFFLYLFRLPCVYLGVCHTLTICFVLSLILHVCGKVAVITQRVESFATKSKFAFDISIRRHVEAHLQLIDIVKSIENIFQYILLLDLMHTSVRLGLSSYVALKNKESDSGFVAMCTFASYAGVIFTLLFLYCFVGEYLTQESINLMNAYYHCNWQEMPLSCKNSFMICMICSQNHLTFTAGKFYKFSLYGFTGIVKTSMAYLSMLRTII